ncbi:divalent-cation tolerance protein CutA [Thermomonospora amylolytica]|uniref:divalent-cation tolerance protein CutA n=1 Tax=Thermomonospora amylolytica TaxID=1411117 RepID=UPI000E6B52A9|nr:divalent-cation tolerance protein CutA [Thermomonospora amylolytica]
MAEHVEVHVTTGSRDEARKITRAVVEGRVAAGAQIVGPISSTYWWRGEIQEDEEFLVLMKTAEDKLEELTSVVRACHSYEVPEIVAVPIVGGLGEYLGWITAETEAGRPAE